MRKELKSFNLSLFTWISVVLLLIPLAIALPLNLLVFNQSFSNHFLIHAIILVLGYIVIIPVHEGLHALSAIIFGRISPKKIKFGMVAKQMMFYCHCDGSMEIYKYRIMLITPFIIVGIIPLIITTIFCNPLMPFLFSMSISGCAGDIVMFFSTFRYDKNQLVEDHPTLPAYYLVYPSDESEKNDQETDTEQK